MTTYFAGGGFDCWVPSPTGCADGATFITAGGGGASCKAILVDAANTPVSVTSLWFHCTITANNYAPDNGNIPVVFRDSANTARARLRFVSTQGYVFEYYNGAAWVSCPPVDVGQAFGGTIDARIVISATVGRIEWYNNGILCAQLVGQDTSGMGTIAYVQVYAVETYIGSGRYDNTIIASYNTIGHSLLRRTATGNGPEQDWTGDYTAIDEAVTDDNDVISTSTTGAVSTFTGTMLAAPAAGNVIKSVVIGSRIRANGGAPTRVQAAITVAGTKYYGPSIAGGGGFNGYTTAFDLNPATGSAWADISAVNGAFGVKAVA